MNKIAIACDHAGYERKIDVIKYLNEQGFEVVDFGCNSLDSCDYADYVHPLASKIDKGELKRGIIICGSANGVNMTANKYQNVRSALCWQSEIAELARSHNDANVCAIPARFTSLEVSLDIVKTFLNTDFEGGRHTRRVEKIAIQKQ
ncbi:ribose 5-phosphate isomerase B [Halosquirtibacter xylanolyticus]|uniref:ribose 5-phosphate isomerase B n=1 Tax=Halosquirtibacter xylanolyticus TaxID=3374599 RepID=UPI00374A6569|nr:ribose 5-phosphate isomerase B [Prolixibacteraceae bacterium]